MKSLKERSRPGQAMSANTTAPRTSGEVGSQVLQCTKEGVKDTLNIRRRVTKVLHQDQLCHWEGEAILLPLYMYAAYD